MEITLKHGLWNGDYGLSLQVPDRWYTTVLPLVLPDATIQTLN